MALLTNIIPQEAIAENVNSKSAPPPVAFVHPKLATLARPAPHAVSNNNHLFLLKNPNFGLGLGGAAASAAIHSCIFATSHVI